MIEALTAVAMKVMKAIRELIALMMEAVQTSETSVNSHQSTRRYNPEDSHLHIKI
jgi:hypothetical protein